MSESRVCSHNWSSPFVTVYMLVAKELLPNAAEHALQKEVKLVFLSNTSKATNIRNDIKQSTAGHVGQEMLRECKHIITWMQMFATATSNLSSSGPMLVTKAVGDVLVASVVVPESPLCRTD